MDNDEEDLENRDGSELGADIGEESVQKHQTRSAEKSDHEVVLVTALEAKIENAKQQLRALSLLFAADSSRLHQLAIAFATTRLPALFPLAANCLVFSCLSAVVVVVGFAHHLVTFERTPTTRTIRPMPYRSRLQLERDVNHDEEGAENDEDDEEDDGEREVVLVLLGGAVNGWLRGHHIRAGDGHAVEVTEHDVRDGRVDEEQHIHGGANVTP